MMRTASSGRLRAFTLIELLVVISIIALLVAILLPALGRARQAAQQMKSNTQLRGIQMANFIFAQDNEGNYAGIDDIRGVYSREADAAFTDASDIATFDPTLDSGLAEIAGAYPQARFCILLEGNYFAPEYLQSPAERNSAFALWTSSGTYRGYTGFSRFTSYALPAWKRGHNSLDTAGTHLDDMQPARIVAATADQLDATTPAASDRKLSGVSGTDYWAHQSLWSQGDSGWIGGMSFNDNHVTFLQTSGPTQKFTFGDGGEKPAGLGDNIFTFYTGGGQNPDNMWPIVANDANAWMVINRVDQDAYVWGD